MLCIAQRDVPIALGMHSVPIAAQSFDVAFLDRHPFHGQSFGMRVVPMFTSLLGSSLVCLLGCKISPPAEPSEGGPKSQLDDGAVQDGSAPTREGVEEEIEVMLGELDDNNAIRMTLASSGQSIEVQRGIRGNREEEMAILLCHGSNAIQFAKCVNQVLTAGGCANVWHEDGTYCANDNCSIP